MPARFHRIIDQQAQVSSLETFYSKLESLTIVLLLKYIEQQPSYPWYSPGGGGGIHDILGRGCATIKSLYRPFLEFLTKKLDPFRNFCA